MGAMKICDRILNFFKSVSPFYIMGKFGVILFFVFILISGFGIAQTLEGSFSGDIEGYANIAGDNILKFQEFILGALTFISLGVFKGGGTLAFTQFLFMILIFVTIYTIGGFFSGKFNLIFSLIVTILAFLTIDVESIQAILVSYESMGIAITVILPILILLAFTFRIYERAYSGKGETSPFYAEVFNFVFLVFFGIFFIRHSASEEGMIAIIRFFSGWILIALGIMQTILYKILAGMISKGMIKGAIEEKRRKTQLIEAKRELELLEVEEIVEEKKEEEKEE